MGGPDHADLLMLHILRVDLGHGGAGAGGELHYAVCRRAGALNEENSGVTSH